MLAVIAPLALSLAPAQDIVGREVTPEVRDAAARGLDYLAETQDESGAWIADVGFKLNDSYRRLSNGVPHVGVTALCGMAFLAGGHLPDRGKYGENLERAIEWLISQVNDLGFITAHQTRMYSHAFATLFLAEVYGMTARDDVGRELQTAVNLIVDAQNKQGSWRYEPFALESDMSITVCQLMALRAARNIGIKVPVSTIERAVEYVLVSQVQPGEFTPFFRDNSGYYRSGEGAFKYQNESDARSSFALTAAGVTSLYHAARYDTRTLRKSLDFLEDELQKISDKWSDHYFFYYGHYYAVQAMFITGGQRWERYWRSTSRHLLANQRPDGHWPNRVGPGDALATAVACIVLQSPYRYLPILQR